MSEHAQGTRRQGRRDQGVVIDAVFPDELPGIYNALAIGVPSADGSSRTLIAEVQQHLGDDRVRAVAMDSTDGLARGTDVVDTGKPISVPVGDATLGRIWNVIGEPVDNKEAAGADVERWSIHRDPPAFRELMTIEIFETGLKVVDLIAPYVRAARSALRWCRRRQDGADPGADPQRRPAAWRRLRLRRRRRAHPRGERPLPRDDRVRGDRQGRAGLRADERAAGRASSRRPLGPDDGGSVTRDKGQDTLLFIDNIFRFVQAGSEVSALLGRMPSAVGYQPTLATEMGQLQERITSTPTAP